MPKKAVEHRSVRFGRTQIDDEQGQLEKAAAEWWEAECKRRSDQDSFPGALLVPGEAMKKRHLAIPVIKLLTQEEATTAATIFQWIFTNMGRAALQEVYKKVGGKVVFMNQKTLEREDAQKNKRDSKARPNG